MPCYDILMFSCAMWEEVVNLNLKKINNTIRQAFEEVLVSINLENEIELGKTVGKDKSWKAVL